jgi:subtilisin family serine protease
MTMRSTSLLVLLSLGLISISACERDTTSSTSQSPRLAPPTDLSPYYLYNGTAVPLEVDPERLAVRTDIPDAGGVARQVLAGLGITPTSVRALQQIAGHWEIKLPRTSVPVAIAAKKRLLADPRFTFATVGYRIAGTAARILPIDRVAVEFKVGTTRTQIDGLAQTHGLTVEREANPSAAQFAFWFRYARGSDPLLVAAALDRSPIVLWANPDKLSDVVRHFVPIDPYYVDQFHLKNSNMLNGVRVDDNVEPAWDLNKGGGLPSSGGLVIAVIDDGVDAAHPEFDGRVQRGYDEFGNNTPGCTGCATNPDGDYSHGTLVAGIIGARHDGQGVVGIAPDAFITPIRIFNGAGDAVSECDIAHGIDYAWQLEGATVLSNSWGYPPGYPGNNCVTNAIYRAKTQGRGGLGSVVVFSAGNTSDRRNNQIGPVTYPATLPTVIAVGAINRQGAPTNYTPEGPTLDVVAPSGHDTDRCVGEVVTTDLVGARGCSDYPNNVDYSNTFSGTSAAAPQVSAVAAMVVTANLGLTADEVADRIYSGANAWGPAVRFGAGKLNAYNSVLAAQPPPPPPLLVSIDGPSPVQPFSACLYTALATGGTPPYSYAWTADGSPVGDNSAYYRHSAGTSSFGLMVIITDAVAGGASDSKSVTVDAGAPECLDQ